MKLKKIPHSFPSCGRDWSFDIALSGVKASFTAMMTASVNFLICDCI